MGRHFSPSGTWAGWALTLGLALSPRGRLYSLRGARALLPSALLAPSPTYDNLSSSKVKLALTVAALPVLNTPGAHSSLSTPVFREAVAALLFAPSPVCRDKVGEMIGRKRVDLFGDHIFGQNLTSDVKTRWRPFLESGCRTGIELARAWEVLQAGWFIWPSPVGSTMVFCTILSPAYFHNTMM